MAENTDTVKKPKLPKERTEGKGTVSSKRVFGDQTYQTDLREYASKEDAKDVIIYLKLIDKTVKARVVEKGTGAYIYYDEPSYAKIELLTIPIPSIEGVRREIVRLNEEAKLAAEKPKKPAPKKQQMDPPLDSQKSDPVIISNPSQNVDSAQVSKPKIRKKPVDPSQKSSINNPAEPAQVSSSSQSSSGQSSSTNKSSMSDQSTTSKPKKMVIKSSTDQPKENISSGTKGSEIVNRIVYERPESIPEYLLTRLSKDARIYMKMGILEIERTQKKKLEYAINLLRAEQVKYDITFEKDKGVIDYMNHVSKLMNDRVQKYLEEESQEFIHKEIINPMEKGKFNKYLSELSSKGIDETAYLIFKKVNSKKYPQNESQLIKTIKKIIEERAKPK